MYFKLKLARFSDSDFNDCLEYFKFSVKNNELVDIDEIIKIVKSFLKNTSEKDKSARIKKLIDEIS